MPDLSGSRRTVAYCRAGIPPGTTELHAPTWHSRVAGRKARSRALLDEARPTNDAALREAFDEAARNPELAPLVRVVESVNVPA